MMVMRKEGLNSVNTYINSRLLRLEIGYLSILTFRCSCYVCATHLLLLAFPSFFCFFGLLRYRYRQISLCWLSLAFQHTQAIAIRVHKCIKTCISETILPKFSGAVSNNLQSILFTSLGSGARTVSRPRVRAYERNGSSRISARRSRKSISVTSAQFPAPRSPAPALLQPIFYTRSQRSAPTHQIFGPLRSAPMFQAAN